MRSNMKRDIRILLTMRVELSGSPEERRDAISHDWLACLDALGWTPVLLPNRPSQVIAMLERERPEACILSGGNDVGPVDARDVSGASAAPERDAVEREVLRYAVDRGCPVLGVCRGMQMINVFFGGRLIRDLTGLAPATGSHAGTLHRLTLTHATFRTWAGAPEIESNSFHRNGVTAETLAPTLRVMAQCGPVIEAVAHTTLPIVGIQWHPERDRSAVRLDNRLFEALPGGFADLIPASAAGPGPA